jgi:1,4-dihydroxy-2-naphthoyl-CoA hydrolase
MADPDETAAPTWPATPPAPGDLPGATAGLNGVLGLEFVSADGDGVVVRCPVGAHLKQPMGLVHGGVYCALVETAGSYAGALWLAGTGHVVGISNHTDFLRPVRDGVLTATATPIHRGRSQQLWLVEIRDQAGTMVARRQVRLHNLPLNPGDGASTGGAGAGE